MSAIAPNFLLERERNQSTRGGFDRYAQHRAEPMAVIDGLRGERLAVLGAGKTGGKTRPSRWRRRSRPGPSCARC